MAHQHGGAQHALMMRPRPITLVAAGQRVRTIQTGLGGALLLRGQKSSLPLSAAVPENRSEQETNALEAFSGGGALMGPELVPTAIDTLRRAAPPNKSVPPAEVQGSMAALESLRESCRDLPGFALEGEELLGAIKGDWILHFSTFSQAFPYLPIKEVVRIGSEEPKISVINRFGPIGLTFSSPFEFDDAVSCEFGFDALTVDVFGTTLLEKPIAERKMKTYDFFYTEDGMACVRSSSGALTLLFRT